MAAATTSASTSLAGQPLDLSRNSVAGKVNVCEARFLTIAKAMVEKSIWNEGDAVDCEWDAAGLSSDPETFIKNPRLCRDSAAWQLTVGRLLKSGSTYSYERTKDSGFSQPKQIDIIVSNCSHQRSEQSKEDKKLHLSTKRKPRAPELNQMMASSPRVYCTTAEALDMLKKRLQQGITTHSSSYVQVLQTCMKQKELFATKQVHVCMIQSGMDKNPFVAGTLMNVYIKSGALVDARCVFYQLDTKNVVDWTMIIAKYVERDDAESAFKLFNQMCEEGVEPDEITYLSILKACASPGALRKGKQIHEYIRYGGFDSDMRIGNALINMYAKCGSIMEARKVFENLTKRDVITWNVMIGGLAQHGYGHEAYQLFCRMKREGLEPDAFNLCKHPKCTSKCGGFAVGDRCPWPCEKSGPGVRLACG